jgi:hypothetical protein
VIDTSELTGIDRSLDYLTGFGCRVNQWLVNGVSGPPVAVGRFLV